MARVTVEDCVDKVPNRFELVMLAAHRARSLASGAPLTVDRDNVEIRESCRVDIASAFIADQDGNKGVGCVDVSAATKE